MVFSCDNFEVVFQKKNPKIFKKCLLFDIFFAKISTSVIFWFILAIYNYSFVYKLVKFLSAFKIKISQIRNSWPHWTSKKMWRDLFWFCQKWKSAKLAAKVDSFEVNSEVWSKKRYSDEFLKWERPQICQKLDVSLMTSGAKWRT